MAPAILNNSVQIISDIVFYIDVEICIFVKMLPAYPD